MHAGGMSDLYPYTFSGIGQDAYTPWNFSRFPADAIVINLGIYKLRLFSTTGSPR
jgi:hypothetical protein